MKGPKIVAIGGGTGLSTILRGLKKLTPDLTAIVAVTDNGGGSGVLRRELGMLPPGDVRACIQALANTESTMEELLAYRFKEGSLKGQSLGNLFLAALNDITGSFDAAVSRLSEVLAVSGTVLPVTNANAQLLADFDNGVTITGEEEIAVYKKNTDARIRRVYLSVDRPAALPACLDAIREADVIVLSSGSLYTSVIPNLLVDGISEAIRASSAVKVYVMNLMTQDGETEGYGAEEHIRALLAHGGGPGLVRYCIYNNMEIPDEVLVPYRAEGAAPIRVEPHELEALGVTGIAAPVASWKNGLIRHDPDALAEALADLYREAADTKVWY